MLRVVVAYFRLLLASMRLPCVVGLLFVCCIVRVVIVLFVFV